MNVTQIFPACLKPYLKTCVFVSLGLALGVATLAHAAPRTPSSDAVVLEKLPFRHGDASVRELAALRGAVQAAPTDSPAAAALAGRYFELALAKGDPRYIGYADALVARFAEPLPLSLLSLRGTLRQYRHDFAGALQDFSDVLIADPTDAGAHAWRAAIFLVQARYDDASRECEALLRLKRKVLHGGCAGLQLAYSGHLSNADQALRTALASATEPDHRLWLLTRLAEVATWQGHTTQAERSFRDALRLGRDDVYLLAAWSDFLLDQGRAPEVAQLLGAWESTDGLLLRLAEAQALLKLPAAAANTRNLADRFAAAKLRGDTTHQAEEARFQLRLMRQPLVAVALAADNYRTQKEPRDARVLLEAALAANDAHAAQPVRAWLATSEFQDQRLRKLAHTGAKP